MKEMYDTKVDLKQQGEDLFVQSESLRLRLVHERVNLME